VALSLVRAAGHEAVGFYLQIWFQEDFRNFWDACPWEEDLAYARQVGLTAGRAPLRGRLDGGSMFSSRRACGGWCHPKRLVGGGRGSCGHNKGARVAAGG
jgi:hypothetical protein